MENDNAKKPTIDERLEALAQSLELLTTLHRDLEQQTAARFADTAARFADLGQFINQLAHIAEAHEQRLDRLEGQ
jgi:DNA-binding protein H-NS